ncbi:MAG: HEAT repeat domain-containing protein [Nocardioidaceae bacterium]|jgi:hypothetical protein|nr:HEAT repeat domain-containing protein [Nocardioidaceae bacterium]
MTVPTLPPPSNPDATVRVLVTELGARVGAVTAAGWCADLLSGADPHDHVEMLDYLGSNCRRAAFDPSWYDYWVRTWGARGLLYIWSDSVAPAVVAGLGDEHWRPAEMCLKVSTLREIGESGPGAAALVEHALPRVRQQSLRCLGANGDTEHVALVERAIDDEHADVRRAAAHALARLSQRLDLGIEIPDLG